MNKEKLGKMRKMKFYGMARAMKMSLEAGKDEQFTADELVSDLIYAEWDDRITGVLTGTSVMPSSGIKLL
jgi:hypothetical protein